MAAFSGLAKSALNRVGDRAIGVPAIKEVLFASDDVIVIDVENFALGLKETKIGFIFFSVLDGFVVGLASLFNFTNEC